LSQPGRQGWERTEHPGKKEAERGSTGLLFPASFREERAEPVGAAFTGIELNISGGDQPEHSEEEKIEGV